MRIPLVGTVRVEFVAMNFKSETDPAPMSISAELPEKVELVMRIVTKVVLAGDPNWPSELICNLQLVNVAVTFLTIEVEFSKSPFPVTVVMFERSMFRIKFVATTTLSIRNPTVIDESVRDTKVLSNTTLAPVTAGNCQTQDVVSAHIMLLFVIRSAVLLRYRLTKKRSRSLFAVTTTLVRDSVNPVIEVIE